MSKQFNQQTLDSNFFDIEVIEDNTEEEYKKKNKGINLFTYLQDICKFKTGTVPERGDFEMKKFDSYMIMKFLSLNIYYLPIVNIFNQYTGILTKKELYGTLLKVIPKSKAFLKYPKLQEHAHAAEDIKALKIYFECPERDAIQYLDLELISKREIDKIKEKIGGKV